LRRDTAAASAACRLICPHIGAWDGGKLSDNCPTMSPNPYPRSSGSSPEGGTEVWNGIRNCLPESKTAGWKARPPMQCAANAASPRSVALFRRDLLLAAVAHALLGGEEGIVEV